MDELLHLQSPTGRATMDCAVGNIPTLVFAGGGRQLRPLHSAPWRDEPDVQANPNLPAVDRRLAGDFFCAPFGHADEEGVPPHGWPANSAWDALSRSEGEALLQLRRTVKGAMIRKHVALAADAPILYQEHTIAGGAGCLTCAHHPMVRSAGRARFSTSPKRALITPGIPLEEGRGVLAYPQRADDLRQVKTRDGGSLDLARLPIGESHEDFAVLVEAPARVLGWSAVLRDAEDDIVFFLKDARVLPVTMLWFSNGGRDYPPWNGRHRGVLGIEDGCAPGTEGAAANNPIAREGVRTCLSLGAESVHRIAHVTGAIPRPDGWTAVNAIRIDGRKLVLEGDGGLPVALNWRSGFFGEGL